MDGVAGNIGRSRTGVVAVGVRTVVLSTHFACTRINVCVCVCVSICLSVCKSINTTILQKNGLNCAALLLAFPFFNCS